MSMSSVLDRSGSGVLVTQEPAFRRFWYPVARADAVGVAPVSRRLLGEHLVVWRSGPDQVNAAQDRCPHRDARLSAGTVEGCSLVCAYHGWEFGADGSATNIPQVGSGAPLPPKAALATFACQQRWGWVWVCLGDPIAALPDLSVAETPGWRVVHEPESEWHCSALHLMDNNMDPGHVAFVHRNSFGTTQRPEVPVNRPERTPYGLHVVYDLPVESRPGEVGGTVRHSDLRVFVPFLMINHITYPDGVVHCMIKACTPVADGETRQLQMVLRSDAEADRPAADIMAFDGQVWGEDKAVLERTWPDYHVDVAANVHLSTDRVSIEYRRRIGELIKEG
jgi:phenylpropionate dioxygenase-like ring-hydroxylating dioxygenase large terminal subunit